MVAIGIILTYFLSVTIPPTGAAIIRFGIGYLPLILISILYGPIYGLMAGISQDLLGIFLIGAPVYGYAFSPVYTFNAALYGVLPGLLFQLRFRRDKLLFFWLNYALLTLFVGVAGYYFFNIENVYSQTLGAAEKYVLLAIGVAAAGVLAVLNLIVYRKARYGEFGPKLLFVVLILYMIVSLGTTPLQIALYQAIPYWSLLPLRIIKMPIEVMIYVVLLVTLLKLLVQLANHKHLNQEE